MSVLKPPFRPGRRIRSVRGYPIRIGFDGASYIGRFLDYRGIFEEAIIGKLASVLQPGATFVDIGANIGLHSLVAAHKVGPTGRVLAVEPQRSVYERLEANITLNNFAQIHAVNLAVGVTESELPLYQLSESNDGLATLSLAPGEHSSGAETVRVEPLDKLLQREFGEVPIQAIKVDVEGAELDVLRSAAATFHKSPPRHVFVECIEHHLNRFSATSGMLIRWLEEAGFEVRGLKAGSWVPVRPQDGLNMDLLATRH